MEIPKMKVFVYVLTFLGYAWSGYGAGIISNLRDAILAAEQVFGDVFENIITVAKKFKIAHEVFDAAVEEDCKYTCPDGKKFCELLGCVKEKFVSKFRKKNWNILGYECVALKMEARSSSETSVISADMPAYRYFREKILSHTLIYSRGTD
jgi:hypothetical protein